MSDKTLRIEILRTCMCGNVMHYKGDVLETGESLEAAEFNGLINAGLARATTKEVSDAGKAAAPAAQFDADAIINGTVAEVTERLAGLNAAQLALVAAAENDREKPRAGVHAAIDALQAAE